jgi:uncharacterized protein (DUF362 family)
MVKGNCYVKEVGMKKTEKLSRRKFLKKGLTLGLVTGGAVVLGRPDFLFAKDTTKGAPDLVAVKNGEPDALFKKAIELIGGMEQFVKKGQTVVVKPNICGPHKPELAATTNPILVKAICESCYQAGAKKVYVFDNVSFHRVGTLNKCYKLSGIEDAVKSVGAVMVPSDDFKAYKQVRIPGNSNKLASTYVHEIVLNSDVFINVPILKSHGFTQMTVAMKNLMGVVYDRQEYHEKGLDECIADFCLFGKPHLNVVDAYRVKMGGGQGPAWNEKSSDIELKKTILISRDIVAVDAAGAKILGLSPEYIKYINLAHRMKIGNMNLKELKIVTHAM